MCISARLGETHLLVQDLGSAKNLTTKHLTVRALRGSAKSHSEAHLLYERVFGRMADDAFCVTVQPGPEDLVPNSPVELVRVCQDAISSGRPLARHSPRRKPMSNCINYA